MKYIVRYSLIILITSCSRPTQVQETSTDPLGDNEIVLTQAQYDAAKISLGKIERRQIASHITVTGKLDVPPQNLVSITAPMGGFIKSTDLLQGMKVIKGSLLVVLENPEYIQLQQDYLDNKSKLEFLETEYNRQKELAKENVNALKALQQSKAQYESMSAIVSGLAAKLKLINIAPATLSSGKIASTINLYAPVTGYITSVNVNVGQFVNATEVMFNIVNLDHIHAELQVYEKDVNKISIGQKVQFRLAHESAYRTATIYLIGKEITPERTVRVHCHLDKEDPALLPGMFVSADIEINANEGNVVPNAAIVNYEGKNYVFVPSGDRRFTATPIVTGTISGEFTELQDGDLDTTKSIVKTGAFELIGLLKNKDEDE
ncbi:MAG TPA: efflux RND transporter periplasmic adaptor subunit [Cyclobacteriaceae bacterium]|nr:efflux RND transporter periplasmic adaptor subunit [Cyclobacteriaceae bacterium]